MTEKNKNSVPKETIFKKVYDFYSKDLTSQEVERIFFKETPTRYKYFVRSMEKPEGKKNRLSRYFAFTRNFALAFLRKLSPVVRITFSLNIDFCHAAWKLGLRIFFFHSCQSYTYV